MADTSSRMQPALAYGRWRRRPHAGWRDATGNAHLLALCLAVAVVSAVIAFLCAVWGGGWVVLGGIFGQGLLVAIALHLVYQRVRLQHRSIAIAAAVTTALGAALLVYVGLWIRDVRTCWGLVGGGLRDLPAMLMVGVSRPYRFYDMLVASRTGHHGLLGFLWLRTQNSPSFPILAAAHVAVTVFLPTALLTKWRPGAICPVCGEWLGEGRNAAVLAGWQAGELSAAVARGDVEQVLALVRESATVTLQGACTVAHVWTCLNCQAMLADVVLRPAGDVMLRPTVVDEQMTMALRSEPVAPAGEGTDTGNTET